MINPHTNFKQQIGGLVKRINLGVGVNLILVFGLILRLISLNQSLWLDEATSALVAKMPLTHIFTKFLPGDFHPPLYYLILKYWSGIFGYSEVALRAPSVIFGLFTIYFVYKISKNNLAPLLLATSGLAVYYSQEARMYSLAALLVTLTVYLFIKRKWLIFSLALAAVAMTDYVSLLILPVFWIVGWKERKKLAFSHIPLVVVFTAWSPTFIKQLSAGLSQSGSAWWNILGTVSVKNVVLIPIKFIFGRISFDDKTLYSILAFAAAVLFGYALYKAKKAERLLWYWLVVPIALGAALSFKVPTLSYFRFLFCLPALYILISKSKISRALIFTILFINLVSASYYLLNPRFHREDWRAAAKAIDSQQIVLPSASQKEALVYYGKGDQIVEFPTGTTIWLSRYVWEIVDPADATRLKIENLGYNKVGEYDFNGVVFWKYTKNLYAGKQSLPPRKEGI